jgi:hypothetical protein
MIKQVINRLVRWAVKPQNTDTQEALTTRGTNMLLEHMPSALLVTPISNGYILRVESNTALGEMGNTILIYAQDEKGIADEIIAHRARKKLDVPRQGELFDQGVVLGTQAKQTKSNSQAASAAQRSQ